MREITEQTETVDGEPVFWRSAPWDGTPTLYLHGVPTGSFDWIPFLERTGGLAPDLPGFGRSTKRGTREFTIDGQAEFVEWFLDERGLDEVNLVVHDWGAVGLAWAQAQPSASGGWWSSTRSPSFPATAGTAPPASGARRGSARCRWA
jgi:pimeloyl-ACP methyl ester carboxylesterase